MKTILSIIFVLGLIISGYSQTDEKKTIISNFENFDISCFSRIKLENKITPYTLKTVVYNIGWEKYGGGPDIVSRITGLDKKYLRSAFSFSLKKNSDKRHSFPVNDKTFDFEYFNENIPTLSQQPIKVIIYVTLYKTDSIPIVIINNIKLQD